MLKSLHLVIAPDFSVPCNVYWAEFTGRIHTSSVFQFVIPDGPFLCRSRMSYSVRSLCGTGKGANCSLTRKVPEAPLVRVNNQRP